MLGSIQVRKIFLLKKASVFRERITIEQDQILPFPGGFHSIKKFYNDVLELILGHIKEYRHEEPC